MLEEKALQHRCPRRVDSNGQLEYCYGSECMAWTAYNCEDKKCGHCVDIFGE